MLITILKSRNFALLDLLLEFGADPEKLKMEDAWLGFKNGGIEAVDYLLERGWSFNNAPFKTWSYEGEIYHSYSENLINTLSIHNSITPTILQQLLNRGALLNEINGGRCGGTILWSLEGDCYTMLRASEDTLNLLRRLGARSVPPQ